MRILVSACLLGLACRYDGKSKPCPALLERLDDHQWVPVCPEQLGGLPTPRPPAEIRAGRVINLEGRDVTAAYRRGAEQTLALYRLLDCQAAVLKSRSPSCGCGRIYDGAFSGTLTQGDGITTRLLKANDIPVFTEEDALPFLSDGQ